MNHNTAGIIVQNKTLLPIQVFCHTKLETISELLFDNFFAAEIKADNAITPPQQRLKL